MLNQSLSKGLLSKLFFIKLSVILFSNKFNRLPSSTPDSTSSGFKNKPLKPAAVRLCHGSTANQSACRFTEFNSCLKVFFLITLMAAKHLGGKWKSQSSVSGSFQGSSACFASRTVPCANTVLQSTSISRRGAGFLQKGSRGQNNLLQTSTSTLQPQSHKC